ncbi:unnamed protein product [Owenia fusiformis]|uniref:BRICHOS domain-containing protein n=1 Tax=Owenia fusiformis TaxID=6347 RepID=A0A8S4NRT5_OWEFU|nr:unnamed protein product [Owenia fusiformis]
MKPDISIGKEEKGDVRIFTSSPMPQPTPSVAPRRNGRKYVCVSVTVVLVVAMVIGGFFGAMHMMHKNTLKTFETTMINAEGRYMKEKIQIDEDKETATVEGNDDMTQFKLIMDYKHNLSVSRVWLNKRQESVCYVAPLNKPGLPSLRELEQYLETHKEEIPERSGDPIRESFSINIDPIEDISFLGDEVEAMCKGLKAYWAIPRQEEGSRHHREKRQTGDEQPDTTPEDNAFHPNVTIHCPLPKYGFLFCNQDTETQCTYDCCESYLCYPVFFGPFYYYNCYYNDCTLTVTKDPCHCVFRSQFMFPPSEDE